jgi:hypothetical protein
LIEERLDPIADNTPRPLSLKLGFPARRLCLDVASGGTWLYAENTLATKHFDDDAPLFSPLGQLSLPARVVALIRARDLRCFALAEETYDGFPIDIIVLIWNV